MREEARGILGSEGKGVLLSFFFLLPPPSTNDPFIPIPIRTPLRGECWITPRKSVLDFLSRVTKQTLNRENSSCFSLFFGFCYSYTFILHVSTPFLFFRRRKGVCTSVESFRIGSFIPLILTSYRDVRNEFFLAYL